MTEETRLRDLICTLAKSLFDRGLTHGSTGNISARTHDGGLLVSPTGSSFGRLDPGLAQPFRCQWLKHLSGDQPTKEMPLHSAFYDTRSQAGAVVHLHSCHAVAWSLMPDVDEDDFLPHLTPYAIMQLGRVKLLPFFRPGDPAMGDAVKGLAKQALGGDAGKSRTGGGRQGRRSGMQCYRGARSQCAASCADVRLSSAAFEQGAGRRSIVTSFNVEWEA